MEAKEMPLTPATLVRLHRAGARRASINRNTAVKVFDAVFDDGRRSRRPM